MRPPVPLLAVVGDLVEDVVVWLDGPIEPGTDTAGRVFRSLGGSAANVASAAQVPAVFIGCVGVDRCGDELIAELTRRGVQTRVQRRGRTGTVVVLVEPGGERTMVPDRAAAADLAFRADEPAEVLSGVSVLHVPAYGLDGGRTGVAVRSLLSAALQRQVAVSLDASSTAVLRRCGVARYRLLVEQVRPVGLFANAQEAELLALLQQPIDGVTVVVKNGPRPTAILTAEGDARQVAVTPVQAVRDTTGAGDAFAAGYLSAMLRGEPADRCVQHGHRLAAQGLAKPGAWRAGGPAA